MAHRPVVVAAAAGAPPRKPILAAPTGPCDCRAVPAARGAAGRSVRPATGPFVPAGRSIALRRLVVVRLAAQDLAGAKELLQQHHSGQLVRQGERREGEPLCGARLHLARESQRAANHETRAAALAVDGRALDTSLTSRTE